MSLDLLKERFGHSVPKNKKDADNKEKIHETLNAKFNSDNITGNKEAINETLNAKFNSNSMDGLKSFKAQH
jgi:hypothetical protein